MTFPLFPDQASRVAGQTDHLYLALLGISAVVMTVVFGPMIYFLFKYRRGKPADRRPVRLPVMKIEITWTTVTLLVFLGLFAWGADLYFTIEQAPRDAMEIDVVGKQWMWKVQHPEGNREINELHVPVGRTVKLTLASQDVIHSFYLPAFRIKQDVVPGRYSSEWLKADRVGTYHIFCSEYCGTHHSAMIGRVIVMSPADYAQWLAQGRPESTLAQSGERRFRELGCSGCHFGSSIVRAPRLEGIFGKPVPLQGGGMTVADEAYLRDSILLPNKDVSAGFDPVMPSYQNRVSEEELFELIAYIRSLGTASPDTGTTPEGRR
jgi:cytochrome c oxidase subunit 2